MKKPASLLIGLSDPVDIIRELKLLTQAPWFLKYAEFAAKQMVTHLLVDSAKTWRQAARQAGKGRMIYAALQKELQGPFGVIVRQEIQRNADYITGVPADVARDMTKHVMEQSMKGVRASAIAEELKDKYKHISTVKANLIARTETSKTSTAISQGRSELLGIGWYRWRTSEDGRVRESHRKMDDVLISWDDPPSPEELDGLESEGHYHAGCIWNCRCYTEPLVDLDFVQWPCKVYRRGKIVSMTRSQFERIM